MDFTQKYLIGNRFIRAGITKPNENTLTLMPVRSLVYIPETEPEIPCRCLLDEKRKPFLLLADHHKSHKHIVYLGLHLNATIEYTRQGARIDPVTKMAAGEAILEKKTMPVVKEVKNVLNENQVLITQLIYYMEEAPNKIDLIDGNPILSIQAISGIFRVEAAS